MQHAWRSLRLAEGTSVFNSFSPLFVFGFSLGLTVGLSLRHGTDRQRQHEGGRLAEEEAWQEEEHGGAVLGVRQEQRTPAAGGHGTRRGGGRERERERRGGGVGGGRGRGRIEM